MKKMHFSHLELAVTVAALEPAFVKVSHTLEVSFTLILTACSECSDSPLVGRQSPSSP